MGLAASLSALGGVLTVIGAILVSPFMLIFLLGLGLLFAGLFLFDVGGDE